MFPDIKPVGAGIKGSRYLSNTKMRKFIEKVLIEAAKETEKLFNEITDTWTHEVTITISEVEWNPDANISIYTDDEIFFYLDKGADRWVKMYPSFVPKTKAKPPVTYKSGVGGGPQSPAHYYDHKVAHIDERGWTEEMQKKMNLVMIKSVGMTLVDIAKNLFTRNG